MSLSHPGVSMIKGYSKSFSIVTWVQAAKGCSGGTTAHNLSLHSGDRTWI